MKNDSPKTGPIADRMTARKKIASTSSPRKMVIASLISFPIASPTKHIINKTTNINATTSSVWSKFLRPFAITHVSGNNSPGTKSTKSSAST